MASLIGALGKILGEKTRGEESQKLHGGITKKKGTRRNLEGEEIGPFQRANSNLTKPSSKGMPKGGLQTGRGDIRKRGRKRERSRRKDRGPCTLFGYQRGV